MAKTPSPIPTQLQVDPIEEVKAEQSKARKVKLVHVHSPSEHVGNASTIQSGAKYEMEENAAGGVDVKSKLTNRLIVIPAGNIRVYEIDTGEAVVPSKRRSSR